VLASILSGVLGRRDSGPVSDVLEVVGPIVGAAFVITGLGALVSALLALTRDHERNWAVWIALAFGVFSVIF
jgi:hypothetical protein